MDLTFEQFMKAVDDEINQKSGLMGITHEDLADFLYYDAWEDGASPRDTAHEVLANDSLGNMLLE